MGKKRNIAPRVFRVEMIIDQDMCISNPERTVVEIGPPFIDTAAAMRWLKSNAKDSTTYRIVCTTKLVQVKEELQRKLIFSEDRDVIRAKRNRDTGGTDAATATATATATGNDKGKPAHGTNDTVKSGK